MLAKVEARRPNEYEGLHVGPIYDWVHKYQESIKDPLKLSAFRRFVTGSFLCKERQQRHSNRAVDPRCLLCPEVETVSHIVAGCVRHCYGYHREYLAQLTEQAAARLMKNGIPLHEPCSVAAGYPAYTQFMSSVIAALIQRDVDVANMLPRELEPQQKEPSVTEVRRRLRGKQSVQPCPKLLSKSLTRRRLTRKQPRPASYALSAKLGIKKT
eukprot:6466640-Amphidinium_carterae.1